MIVYFFSLTISLFLFALIIKYFRGQFYNLADNSLSLVDTLLLKINEDEKVKLVQKQNNLLLLSLLKVTLVTATAIILAAIPIYLYLVYYDVAYADITFSSLENIIAISIGSTVGFLIPINKSKTEGYSELSQLLHRLLLNNYAVAYRLFKLEKKQLKKNNPTNDGKFLIVSGLARAGTTSLMNKLAESNQYTSLNYANMPFLTSPNIWRKFYNPKEEKQKERSHKDGILIGLSSNEALEEYFFKMLSNDSYITENSLNQYELTKDDYNDYLNYQRVILNNSSKTYLAKNNNFAIRYNTMRAHNKAFTIVFMFRDPVSHSASLLEKHKGFIELQKNDGFVLEYMNWLGHHEFGLNQKPFRFNNSPQEYMEDKNSIDYWLQIWINYYTHLLSINKENVLFVDYNDYCTAPNSILNIIQQQLGYEATFSGIPTYENKRAINYACSQELKEAAYNIFNELKSLKIDA